MGPTVDPLALQICGGGSTRVLGAQVFFCHVVSTQVILLIRVSFHRAATPPNSSGNVDLAWWHLRFHSDLVGERPTRKLFLRLSDNFVQHLGSMMTMMDVIFV